jgi:hypothetical protein
MSDCASHEDVALHAGTQGTPRPESPNEFCMVMIWKDLDSLKAFVGEDYNSAHIHPDEAKLVAARTIKHYEAVEV